MGSALSCQRRLDGMEEWGMMAATTVKRENNMVATRDIGSRLELFVDDWLIENMDCVSLQMHRPVPQEVTLQLDRPWESSTSALLTTEKDGDRYRMWYRAGADGEQRAAYLESADGKVWERPNLGLVEFEGSSANNIMKKGTVASELSAFRDENPAATAGQQYKAISRVRHHTDDRDAMRGHASPDGIHWTVLYPDPLLVAPNDGTRPIFDSQNTVFWDGLRGHYTAYLRSWLPDDGSGNTDRGRGFRSIRRSKSEDFLHWTDPKQIDLGDSTPEHLYTNAATPYFRAPHIYLMFPRRFVPERQFHADLDATGASEGVFMTSRDGISWDRRFMAPFIPPGPDPDNWTDRNMTVGRGVVPTGPAEISLYYKEHNRRPAGRFRRGSLRTDGFVSAHATFGGGELVLNYDTSVLGGLRVEVQDAEGRPIPGYTLDDSEEIWGDEIERVARWRGGSELGQLAGQAIRLRFAMTEADIYSLRFR